MELIEIDQIAITNVKCYNLWQQLYVAVGPLHGGNFGQKKTFGFRIFDILYFFSHVFKVYNHMYVVKSYLPIKFCDHSNSYLFLQSWFHETLVQCFSTILNNDLLGS